MIEDRDGNPSKARKISHVSLTEHAARENETAVVVGNFVSKNAINRSGLLSGIEHTEGVASLPSHLSPEDVKLWETASLVSADFPTAEVVTVLKVRVSFNSAFCAGIGHHGWPAIPVCASTRYASTLKSTKPSLKYTFLFLCVEASVWLARWLSVYVCPCLPASSTSSVFANTASSNALRCRVVFISF